MKHLLLTTIAAVLLVGCGPPSPDISIHDAASKGDIEAVKQHIAAGTDANAKTSGGATPLHFAAQAGQKEIIELLIAEGADVNAKYNGGNTPLDWVIRSKPRDKARFL
ncbi:MAG: ankyrin repeat domain-containing protein, partial [Kiritimatiellia bacterium]|nr:ankyrin repeat domain-containing protein [Kiritimatiellia bacterium]